MSGAHASHTSGRKATSSRAQPWNGWPMPTCFSSSDLWLIYVLGHIRHEHHGEFWSDADELPWPTLEHLMEVCPDVDLISVRAGFDGEAFYQGQDAVDLLRLAPPGARFAVALDERKRAPMLAISALWVPQYTELPQRWASLGRWYRAESHLSTSIEYGMGITPAEFGVDELGEDMDGWTPP
jgi:hypothetical protein